MDNQKFEKLMIDRLETAILNAITELQDDNQIRFPADASRNDFFEDCLSGTLDQFDLYDLDPYHLPDCNNIVLDMAKLYGYAT